MNAVVQNVYLSCLDYWTQFTSFAQAHNAETDGSNSKDTKRKRGTTDTDKGTKRKRGATDTDKGTKRKRGPTDKRKHTKCQSPVHHTVHQICPEASRKVWIGELGDIRESEEKQVIGWATKDGEMFGDLLKFKPNAFQTDPREA